MSRLPVRSGREVVKALQTLGYERSHQRGSHIILRQGKEPHNRLTVPDHQVIAKGTLAAIAREIGMTTSDLAKYLN
jgi:predicted RNA binding protein YcfA (HicA-like mRNA interferase family)